MVRRVGFGNREEEPETRKPSRTPSTRQPNTNNKSDIKSMAAGARVFQFVFIIIWLIGWSAGILMAFLFLFSDDGFSTVFLIFWLVLASVFWIMAFRRLIALIRGK